MSDFDDLPKNKKRAVNIVGNSMKYFYTLPVEKRDIALDNLEILYKKQPLSHLKG